jgi:hypothetical protein
LLGYFPTLTENDIEKFSSNFDTLLIDLAVKLNQETFQSKQTLLPENEIISRPVDSPIYIANFVNSQLPKIAFSPISNAKIFLAKKDKIIKILKECV